MNSLNTHRGHLTRLATESTAVMDTMKTSPNLKSTKRLEEIQEAMQDKKLDFEAAQEVIVDMFEEHIGDLPTGTNTSLFLQVQGQHRRRRRVHLQLRPPLWLPSLVESFLSRIAGPPSKTILSSATQPTPSAVQPDSAATGDDSFSTSADVNGFEPTTAAASSSTSTSSGDDSFSTPAVAAGPALLRGPSFSLYGRLACSSFPPP